MNIDFFRLIRMLGAGFCFYFHNFIDMCNKKKVRRKKRVVVCYNTKRTCRCIVGYCGYLHFFLLEDDNKQTSKGNNILHCNNRCSQF